MNATTLVTPLATYRNETPYPFCPGCGHNLILDQLNQALVKLEIDPAKVVLVSDIGCSGLSDQYFGTSAFHGLHGRSVTYASGIKLARPDLKVVVIMGDGGTGIGGTHLLNAARRNLGLTVLVFNNLNFGMTGGQHSTTTPAGAITATTRGGNLERPLDVCASVAVNGAGYVYRGTSWDKDLADRIAEAIAGETFALFDIWELCTAYYVPNNHSSRKELLATMDGLGFATGILAHRQAPEYAADTNVTKPDALLLLTAEGAKKCGRHLAAMGPADRVFALPGLVFARTAAPVTMIDPGRAGKDSLALAATAAMLNQLGLFPIEALEEAVRRKTLGVMGSPA
ncbi:MAG TPA: thiamine pyrophosphate-dependent enzyme [Thermoanaerobaculia bacterium]|jgi:pyruvate/2-oxoacid:ferredoxin oxidoreductase beta subunit|nr:thiamine pyrophosphate-dependent enzyme [Thermoanaerobaculia bacterium]